MARPAPQFRAAHPARRLCVRAGVSWRLWLAAVLLAPAAVVAAASPTAVQAPAPAATPAQVFAPLARWRAAVEAGDTAALTAMYSTAPPARILVSTGLADVARETAFWAQWRDLGLQGLGLQMMTERAAPGGLEEIAFQAALHVQTRSGPRVFYLFARQLWRQGPEGWRILAAGRTDLARLRQPTSLSANLFPAGANPRAEIAAALIRARRRHQRVLIVFGANWCYDCHVLDLALHHSDLTPLLEANYQVVDVDVGEYNRNLDLAAKYQVPLKKGIPALAVLSSAGQLLYSQQQGQFEAARNLGPEDLIRFLNAWKPR